MNCSSGWGLVGGEKAVAYAAAKGGMVLMTQDADTPMEHEDAKSKGMSWDEYARWAVEGRPIARIAAPEEVARAVLFLAGDEASFITGAALPVDGGVSG